jgi:histidinol-phosphatase (PHP family)
MLQKRCGEIKPMIPQDYHMHSNFSPDCVATMASMCESAIELGIPEIGFTEHYDLHPDEPLRDRFRPIPWLAELNRCRAKYGERLTIRAGIELGEPHIFGEQTQAMLAAYPFDYALGSLHWVGNDSVFNPHFFRAYPEAEAYRRFFEELEHMTRIGGFDILSHFDVPVRVAHDVYGGNYDPHQHEEAIRAVLHNCIEQGIALDLNTAALRRKANVLTPAGAILGWYAEMGGERITLGSDAHRPPEIGKHLDTALRLAQQAGLRYLTHFEQRQARLQAIAQTNR